MTPEQLDAIEAKARRGHVVTSYYYPGEGFTDVCSCGAGLIPDGSKRCEDYDETLALVADLRLFRDAVLRVARLKGRWGRLRDDDPRDEVYIALPALCRALSDIDTVAMGALDEQSEDLADDGGGGNRP